MSTVRITNYLESERRLVDPDLVGFLRKKLEKGDILDFLDVVEVAPGILDALFDGWTPEQVDTLIQNAGSAVLDSLAAWIDRRAAPVTPVERPRIHPRIRRPAPLVIPPPLEREASGDERFTPTRLVQRLQSTLRGYIESAYPLSDPSLIRARRILLVHEADGHLLAQEPYIETTTRYASAQESYSELDLPPHIASLFVKLASTTTAHSTPEDTRSILFPSMYQHQARAYRAFPQPGQRRRRRYRHRLGQDRVLPGPAARCPPRRGHPAPGVLRQAGRPGPHHVSDERPGERPARPPAPAAGRARRRRRVPGPRSSGQVTPLRHVHWPHRISRPAPHRP
jgi:hypothetical protein